MKLESLKCPICQNIEYNISYNGFEYNNGKNEIKDFKIINCNNCGLARNYPLPYIDDISADVYQDFSYIDPYENPILWDSFFMPMINKMKKYKKSGKVLDIGCSSGYLLKLAKNNNFEPYGVELNPNAVKYGNDNHGLNILNKDLKVANFESNYFDIIVCSQLMEHIVNPENLLSEIHRVLKSDGILIIDSPNYAGLMVKFWGKKWGGYQPQWHIWQFTPKSISNLLFKNNFNVINVSCRQNIDCNIPNSIIKKIFYYTVYKFINKFTELINRADKLLVVAIKN
jgi:2-polyprenyl-3-methyl-5-hydroxy-6-metoxy-1,4-benzoquinol methylase